MTREEAIKDIEENILPIVGGKSLRMAIDALRQPERKKGDWEMVSQHENPPTYIYSCSECRHKSFGFYNYCPNCGAEMTEEKE